jgi:type IV fimbrial biogenesis protein FimT
LPEGKGRPAFYFLGRMGTMKKTGGFSIFELLIVLAVIAVVSAIVTPNIISWRSNAKLRGAAGNLKGDLEMSKAKAVRERTPVTITFTATNYQVTYTDKDGNARTLRDRQLPAGVRVDLDGTGFGAMGDKTQFNGRGIPIAGSALLVNTKGDQKSIIVSTLGRIRIE